MKKITIQLFALILLFSCNQVEKKKSIQDVVSNKTKGRIQVLNLGTFHMGFTPDANTTEFDEKDKENQRKVKEIVKKLASFNPTVIVVETPPSFDEKLQSEYAEYLKNPKMVFQKPSEIELIAYELGRICKVKKILGIDYRANYNYNIGNEMKNEIDSVSYKKFFQSPYKFFPKINVDEDSLNLLDKLTLINQDRYLDFLITINADILTHVGSKKGFEGADEAAKFYQRNLRMYSNLNRIDLKENDRVFIILGATHTAFFRDFMSRSPKFEMVNTFDYLK